MELKKINQIVDIFTDSTAGIFNALESIASGESFEWLENSEYLDIMYYVSHSGEKYASRAKISYISKVISGNFVTFRLFARFVLINLLL